MCKDYNAKVFRSISPLNMKRRIRIVSVIQNSIAQNTDIGKGVKQVIKDTLDNVEDIGDLSLKKGTRIKKENIYNIHLPKMLHLFEKRIMDYVIPTCIIHIFVLIIRTVFYIPCVLKHFRFIQKKCFCGFPFRGINYIVQIICKSVLKFKRHN